MASTQLIRTPSSSSNRRTWTWSAWVKRGSLTDANQVLFQGIDGGFPEKIQFTASDILEYDHDISGTDYTVFVTDRRFRDINGWMHIVVAKDTTQATETNRIKIYINGEQQSLSEYQLGFPGQNYEGAINKNVAHYIGGNNGGEYFDGSMSHVHFCDGSALAPTVFGSTDSVTGEWQINTSPSFTPGTNGFTVLKDGNTITDQSANSNNFTVSTGTLTKTEDCPSNVFATFNPLSVSRGQSYESGNTDTEVVANAAQIAGSSTLGMSSGKFYAEFQLYSFNTNRSKIGICDNPSELDRANTVLGESTYSISYGGENGNIIANSSTVATASSYTTNDIIGVALNLDDNNILFYKNGVVQNSGTAISINAASSTATGFYFFTVGDSSSSYKSQFKANFGNGYFGTTAVSSAGTNASGNGIFEYDVPANFTALSTKGLNL